MCVLCVLRGVEDSVNILSQATICPQGLNSTLAVLSEQTRHSSIYNDNKNILLLVNKNAFLANLPHALPVIRRFESSLQIYASAGNKQI